MRLGQLGIVLRKLGENLDRLRDFALLGEDHSLLEATLGVARILREIPIDPFERLRMLAPFNQPVYILKVVRVCRRRGKRQSEKQGRERRGGPIHCAILFSGQKRNTAFYQECSQSSQ